MSKSILSATIAATLVLLGVLAPTAGATPVNLKFEGGPVMSGYSTVEVVWKNGTSIAAAENTEGLGDFLSDVAAASGTASTTNVLSTLPEYSTSGLSTTGQVAAYRSTYLGQHQIEPTTSTKIEPAQIEKAIDAEVQGGRLPAPVLDGAGIPETIYVLVMPPDMIVCTEANACSGSTEPRSLFCSFHGSGLYGTTKYTYAEVSDISGDLHGGCGKATGQLENETTNLSDQIAQTVTDPLVGEEVFSWIDQSKGEIGDICGLEDQATDTINGHTWTVQKVWSNISNACIGGTSTFHDPTAEFTATPSANAVALSASGSSTNHIAGIPAGIASYSWDFGDGQSASGATASHAYAAGGQYTVTLTATDSLGFTAHASQRVTVSAPPATASPGGSGTAVGSTATGSADSTTGSGASGAASGGAKASIASAGAPSTTGSGGTVIVSSGQSVQCPPGGAACTVSVQAEVQPAQTAAIKKHKRHGVAVGHATLTVAPGASAKLAFKLNSAGLRLLRAHRHLLVKVTTTVRHGTEAPLESTRTIHISAPSGGHAHKR
jgi:PKD domain